MTVGIDPHQLEHLDQGFDAVVACSSPEDKLPLAALAAEVTDDVGKGRLGVVRADDRDQNRLDRLDRVVPGV